MNERQTAAADPDMCIAHYHINTEMNESRIGRQQQTTTTDRTADSDSRQMHIQRTRQDQTKPGMQSQM
ncbi:hypothetical protein Tco_1161012 [Tanacetum coccineum]